ncbi:MAG: hypothetical protein ABIO16_01180, partial [Nocardioides sp.]
MRCPHGRVAGDRRPAKDHATKAAPWPGQAKPLTVAVAVVDHALGIQRPEWDVQVGDPSRLAEQHSRLRAVAA